MSSLVLFKCIIEEAEILLHTPELMEAISES